MRAKERTTARRQLDKRLNSLRNLDVFAKPSRGWIKAIREALGLNTRQYAKRLGLSQSRAVDIEHAEQDGSITIDSLRRAADALDCQLVYALVPNKPLETLVEDRARKQAIARLNTTGHSMALEDQRVSKEDEEEQLKALMRKLIEQPGSKLWED